ncbi:thioredoxin domain-containing protein [Natronomonas sp. EA1]|uniref:thioredoxin domain-containing protein n=1 Tax=Natronomonas sp. EA1 TaxID=3421655 RepID=UPI003EBFA1A9
MENRLDAEESPYLRQHADNPVAWQPWDDDALEEARERDVPIFLSIGYSACHWCHVMAEESFEDSEVAEVLNEHFVPIKVDREERPDLDSVYITICQLVRGQAGWPLSVWLTPDGKPFFVGTYFPKEEKRGMPGFRSLCERIAESWATPDDRAEIEDRAEQWARAARDELESVSEATEPAETTLTDAANAALRTADRQYGGFGQGQKFPQPGKLHILARAFDRERRDAYREVLTETLDAMANGGLYDHVGGGFHRYCVDREWVVPHFEKMLYDQAELTRAFLAGYRLTGKERYHEVAMETLAFVERELTHEDGGFFSTLDAQSGGEEGAFYVWTPDSVAQALDEDAELVCARYGITEAGNFEGDTVLTIAKSIEELAAEFDTSEADIEARLASAREELDAAREERVRPPRDEKVLASWNGLMISAFAEGALSEPVLAETAAAALEFVREHLWDGHSLSRRYANGEVKGDGYLEDYAFLARGAFDLYQATGEVAHLAFALDLARALVREFYDPDAGTLYFTPAAGESLIARPQELGDSSTPASTGVAAGLLDSLAAFAPDAGFDEAAEATLASHATKVETNPAGHASLALATDAHTHGELELTVAADSLPDAWREQVASTFLDPYTLSVRPPTAEELEPWLDTLNLTAAPPIWAGREARDGPTVYACRNFTCSPPTGSLDEALEWARERL